MRTGQKQGTENARGCSVLGDVGDVRPVTPCKRWTAEEKMIRITSTSVTDELTPVRRSYIV